MLLNPNPNNISIKAPSGTTPFKNNTHGIVFKTIGYHQSYTIIWQKRFETDKNTDRRNMGASLNKN